MAGKILTSREEPTEVEELQEFVFVLHDIMGKEEDPAEDVELLMMQLDNAIMDLAERMETQNVQIHMLSMDVIQLSLQAAAMLKDLKTSFKIISALSAPVNDSEAFVKALSIMRREGDPEIMTRSADPDGGIEVEVELTFTEDKLAEALRLAIAEYIDKTAADAIN